MVAQTASERRPDSVGGNTVSGSQGLIEARGRSETVCWICGIPLEPRKALGPDDSGDYMCAKDDWGACRARADEADL